MAAKASSSSGPARTTLRLGVNVDHVATIRQARGVAYPDPVEAALAAERGGAAGITVHLREDRRHIQDHDVRRLMGVVTTKVNLEMAATDAMVAFACELRPADVCIVPEKREELTTEGGLAVAGRETLLAPMIARLRDAGIVVSLFVEPDEREIDASFACGAAAVELHTGSYANAFDRRAETPAGGTNEVAVDLLEVDAPGRDVLDMRVTEVDVAEVDVAEVADVDHELAALRHAATHAAALGLQVNAGHGLTLENVGPIAALPEIEELNIGHSIVARAMFVGIEEATREMLEACLRARPGAARRALPRSAMRTRPGAAARARPGAHKR